MYLQAQNYIQRNRETNSEAETINTQTDKLRKNRKDKNIQNRKTQKVTHKTHTQTTEKKFFTQSTRNSIVVFVRFKLLKSPVHVTERQFNKIALRS